MTRTGTRRTSVSIEELEVEAMRLPPEERKRLAERLLSSVDPGLSFEEEWAKEVDRRVREIQDGSVDPVPGDDVLRGALDRLE